MQAVVLGSTSAVGHAIVTLLCAQPEWAKVTLILRRPTTDFDEIPGHEKLSVIELPSFDELSTLALQLAGQTIDSMFVSLGAYAKVDGLEMLEKVDFEYVVAAAQLAKQARIRLFSLISSMGADASIPETATGFKWYLRTKGRAEAAVQEVGIERVQIHRPGFLVGRYDSGKAIREKSDGWTAALAWLPRFAVRHVGINCEELARVVVQLSQQRENTQVIFENGHLHDEL